MRIDSEYYNDWLFKAENDLLAANEKINWYPDYIKKGRFGEWLLNNIDWAISRERYWGTPLNVWICNVCEHSLTVPDRDTLGKFAKCRWRLCYSFSFGYIFYPDGPYG